MLHDPLEAPEILTLDQLLGWRRAIRRALGIGLAAPVLLHLVNRRDQRATGRVLAAMAPGRFSEDAGEAMLFAGAEAWWLLQAVARARLRDRVKLLGPSDQLAALYAAADVVVVTAAGRQGDRVTADALAIGAAVVAPGSPTPGPSAPPLDPARLARFCRVDRPRDPQALRHAVGQGLAIGSSLAT